MKDTCLALMVMAVLPACQSPTDTTSPLAKQGAALTQAAERSVRHYHFQTYMVDDQQTLSDQFEFLAQPAGYGIKVNGDWLARDIYYIKTFGGRPPTISIDLIDKRFLVLPETVKGSSIPDTLFHEMMAVTRVYDLKQAKYISQSTPYRYEHDIPLRYQLDKLPH